MEENLIIPALLRLLDTASIRRFNLKAKTVDYEDAIGQKALQISSDIKSKYNLDIFSKKLSNEELTKFEHLIGNAMSNHVNKKLVPRKITDEVKILKESKNIDIKALDKFDITFGPGLSDTLEKIKSIKTETLLSLSKKPLYLSYLPGNELMDQYFSLAVIKIKDIEYFIVFTMRHENRDPKKLSIISLIALPTSEYSKYQQNPTQLFLKGLDKYGVDLKINNKLSRYYLNIEIPLNTNIQSTEFLNFQNLDDKEPFVLAMAMKPTAKSIEMQNVFAIKTNVLLKKLNE
ncbi:MAG: hypothetical protein ACJARP_003225 [Vicingaceae bacterium]|jgi:hypothetical protein